jgi:hypothetical protein
MAIGAGTAAAMAVMASAFNSYHGNYGMTLNQQWVLVTDITKVLSPYFPDCPIAGPSLSGDDKII